MPHNLDILNLEPRLGFTHQQISSFAYLGSYINLSSYVIHRSTLSQLTSKVLPWYGSDLDIALYKNCRVAGIFPQIFKQKDYTSDISESHLIPKDFKELYQKMVESSIFIGWLFMETARLKAIYSIYDLPYSELKDRRIS